LSSGRRNEAAANQRAPIFGSHLMAPCSRSWSKKIEDDTMVQSDLPFCFSCFDRRLNQTAKPRGLTLP
jgi:hypothetical protein